MKTLSFVSFSICFLLLTGCGGPTMFGGPGDMNDPSAYPRHREPRYDWGFCNYSDTNLHGVAIRWWAGGSLTAAAGDLRAIPDKGNRAGDSEGWNPIPDTVTLEWSYDDNVRHEQQMPVASIIPNLPHFSGTVWFKYSKEGIWTVVPLTEEEQLDRRRVYQPVP